MLMRQLGKSDCYIKKKFGGGGCFVLRRIGKCLNFIVCDEFRQIKIPFP